MIDMLCGFLRQKGKAYGEEKRQVKRTERKNAE